MFFYGQKGKKWTEANYLSEQRMAPHGRRVAGLGWQDRFQVEGCRVQVITVMATPLPGSPSKGYQRLPKEKKILIFTLH
jgi:hypothetical protein